MKQFALGSAFVTEVRHFGVAPKIMTVWQIFLATR